ncbi:MAG: hypothetical protein ACP5R4_08420 [Armatimonadota bacterium]
MNVKTSWQWERGWGEGRFVLALTLNLFQFQERNQKLHSMQLGKMGFEDRAGVWEKAGGEGAV